MKGNCIIAQSGGPTAVINASACGTIQEAMKYDNIDQIYGAHNGILGVLNNELYDLRKESSTTIDGLRYTPSSGLGTCRYKVKTDKDFGRIIEVIKQHAIRYFFYIGGNDSQDTVNKVHQLANKEGYELRAIGIPKTVDNDLVGIDHCPGYGSVIKYLAAMVREVGLDTEASYSVDKVNVIETMGRHTGWIAAGTALARQADGQAPDLIVLPEIPFVQDDFLAQVNRRLEKQGHAVIVISEGAKYADGTYVAEVKGDFAVDSFGHKQLGGAALTFKEMIEDNLNVKTRWCRPSIISRNGAHFASQTDADEAYRLGQFAVTSAVGGVSGKMVSLKRVSDEPYRVELELTDLEMVANEEKRIPRDWITEDGYFVNEKFIRYATPLIQGEVKPPIVNGLPEFVRLKKQFI